MALLVGTWNLLATSYYKIDMITQANLSKEDRLIQLKKALEDMKELDILCLQEVDMESLINEIFNETHEIIVCQRPNKPDSCVILLKKNRLNVLNINRVEMNELFNYEKENSYINRFLRDNVGCFVKIYDIKNDRTLIIATCHLFWNPQYPEVKLAQIKKLLLECGKVVIDENLPLILTGDFNSGPDSDVYKLVTSGSIREKEKISSSSISKSSSILPASSPLDLEDLCNRFHKQLLNQMNESEEDFSGGNIRFLCDVSLIKICQWLRLLGFETSLMNVETHPIHESEEGKKMKVAQRKTEAINYYFEKCRNEKRILLTSSKNLLKRNSCPRSFYINNSNMESKGNKAILTGKHNQFLSEKDAELLVSLACLFHEFSMPLDSSKFLTVCGFCGYSIDNCPNDDPRLKDKWIPGDRPVFICQNENCNQSYYWNDCPTSSPALAMEKAFLLAQAISDSLSLQSIKSENETKDNESDTSKNLTGIWEKKSYSLTKNGVTFSHVPEEINNPVLHYGNIYSNFSELSSEERQKIMIEKFNQRQEAINKKRKNDNKDSDNVTNILEEKSNQLINTKRIMERILTCQSLGLESALLKYKGQDPEYSNRTPKFSGSLDYIFIGENSFKVLNAFSLPVPPNYDQPDLTIKELSPLSCYANIDSKQFFPSQNWPSDHFLLVSELEYI